jgi:hypothetical protein
MIHPLPCDGDDRIDPAPVAVEFKFIQRGARKEVAIIDMRLLYEIFMIICMGVGYLVLLAFRKTTG